MGVRGNEGQKIPAAGGQVMSSQDGHPRNQPIMSPVPAVDCMAERGLERNFPPPCDQFFSRKAVGKPSARAEPSNWGSGLEPRLQLSLVSLSPPFQARPTFPGEGSLPCATSSPYNQPQVPASLFSISTLASNRQPTTSAIKPSTTLYQNPETLPYPRKPSTAQPCPKCNPPAAAAPAT
jgi:hypothetical protein